MRRVTISLAQARSNDSIVSPTVGRTDGRLDKRTNERMDDEAIDQPYSRALTALFDNRFRLSGTHSDEIA